MSVGSRFQERRFASFCMPFTQSSIAHFPRAQPLIREHQHLTPSRLAPTLEKLSAARFPRSPHMQLEASGSWAKSEPWGSSQADTA